MAGSTDLSYFHFPLALPLLEQTVGFCKDAQLPFYFPRRAAALGAAYTLGGRVADAVPLLTRAMEQATAMQRVSDAVLYRLSLGEEEVVAGRLEEAHTRAERTLALARKHGERGNEAYALRLLGEIAAQHKPLQCERVEAHYRQAMALAEGLGMRPLVAHCLLGLSTLYAKIGQREQAHVELSATIELYRAMDMTFWLPQAETAMASLSSPPSE